MVTIVTMVTMVTIVTMVTMVTIVTMVTMVTMVPYWYLRTVLYIKCQAVYATYNVMPSNPSQTGDTYVYVEVLQNQLQLNT